MVRFSILLIFLIGSYASWAQTKGVPIILSNNGASGDLNYHIYDPPFLAKPVYSDTTEAVNQYPEQLMSSIMSATSQEWVNYNTLGGAKEAEQKTEQELEMFKRLDKESNYYQLVSKLTFQTNGAEMAIIKFYLQLEIAPRPFSGAYVMQRVDNRWYKTVTTFTSPMALLMMRFDAEKLGMVLKGEETGELFMDELIQLVHTNGQVDFQVLLNEFDSWFSNNDTDRQAYFLDQNSW